MPEEILDEQQETIVNEVLRLFVEYLNAMWDREPINKEELSPYTVEKFTITDPERNLYGKTDWKVLEVPTDGITPDGLMKITTHDGDEGGPSDLYVGLLAAWDRPNDTLHEPIRISWIVHVFDTVPVMMWTRDDGFRTT